MPRLLSFNSERIRFSTHVTLRSDGRPSPRKTRFPAAGPALPDGIGYPQGFNERFHIFEMILFSRVTWRNV
jgi:hypothetical protein